MRVTLPPALAADVRGEVDRIAGPRATRHNKLYVNHHRTWLEVFHSVGNETIKNGRRSVCRIGLMWLEKHCKHYITRSVVYRLLLLCSQQLLYILIRLTPDIGHTAHIIHADHADYADHATYCAQAQGYQDEHKLAGCAYRCVHTHCTHFAFRFSPKCTNPLTL